MWDGSGGQEEQAPSRSRGGFGAERHGWFDGHGRPRERVLTPGQASGVGQAEALLAGHAPEVVVADRGYDKRGLVGRIEERGGQAVIPTRAGFSAQAMAGAR